MLSQPPSVSVRVLIVDDHPMACEWTRGVLEQAGGISVVGVAADGASALRLAVECQSNVVLLDLHLPDLSGVEVARRLRTQNPEAAILVMTGHGAEYVRGLLSIGVQGYMFKTVSGTDLVAAVLAVAEGRLVLAPEALTAAAQRMEPLTPREQQVLELLATGQSNKAIARSLGLSENTVESYIRELYSKVGARSRTEATFLARQQGLLPTEPNLTN